MEKEVTDTTVNENVDTTATEQKVGESKGLEFTPEQQDKINKIVAERTERAKRKIESKYSPLVSVLQAGLNTDDLNKITEEVRKAYSDTGVNIPQQSIPIYNAEEENILAEHEARKISELGYDEVKSVTDEMVKTGENNLSARDKILFKKLAEARKSMEDEKQLESIGVDKSIFESNEFKNFKDKFKSNTDLKEIYNLYEKTQTIEDKPQTIGSVKSSNSAKDIKEYYSAEDVDKLSMDDLKNPKVFERVKASMAKWRK